MDRLVVERESDVLVETEEKTQQKPDKFVEVKAAPPTQTRYLSSLQNMTIADYKKQEEDRELVEFEKEKEKLIAEQYVHEPEIQPQASQNIIEKPNYDLIEENKKVVRFKKNKVEKKKEKKNVAAIALACALGASTIICVTNCVIIENMNANYMQIDETYNLNLSKYLKNIYNLDNTQNGMELIETYPEETLDAGDIGEKSNWFDRLCNFIGGIFGG